MNTRFKYDGEEYDLNDLGVRLNTVSFFCTKNNDEAEPFFGTCDLTGIKGSVVPCIGIAQDSDEIVEFEVLESIVGGRLGKLAGAF